MDGGTQAPSPPLAQRLALAKAALAATRLVEAVALAEPVFRDARDAADWRTAAEAALRMARCQGKLRQGQTRCVGRKRP